MDKGWSCWWKTWPWELSRGRMEGTHSSVSLQDLRWMDKPTVPPVLWGKNPNCVITHPSNLMLNAVPHFMAFVWMMPMVSGFVLWNDKSDTWLQVLQQLQIKEICCFEGRALSPHRALGSC